MPKRRYPFAAFSLSLVVSVFFLISDTSILQAADLRKPAAIALPTLHAGSIRAGSAAVGR
jgi:hypothetical protein